MKKIMVMIMLLSGQLALGMAYEAIFGGIPQFGSAAFRGDLAEVTRLLNQGANANNVNKVGITALMGAAFNGHIEVVRLLLDRGANINAMDQDSRTALMEAAGRGHIEVVRLLLDRGANINMADQAGMTALSRAIGRHDTELVTLLLDRKADINTAGQHGHTALISAAGAGHVAVVRLLLDRGADIQAADQLGWTALFSAASQGQGEAVLELLTFIPVAEHKAIQENIRGLLSALKHKELGQGHGKQMPRDVRQLVGQEVIHRLAREEMPNIMARARLLAAVRANNGAMARDVAIRAYALVGNLPTGNYQAVIDLLDLDSPASQAMLQRQVEANIRRIVASPSEPVAQAQPQAPQAPQSYQSTGKRQKTE